MLTEGGSPWRMNRALRVLWVGGEYGEGCGASAYLRILGGRAKGSGERECWRGT
jgi:hypothetical protein